MNCFFKIDGPFTPLRLLAPFCRAARMSCIELLKHWGIPVSEERPLIIRRCEGFLRRCKLGRYSAPVPLLLSLRLASCAYEGDVAHINNGEIGEVTQLQPYNNS